MAGPWAAAPEQKAAWETKDDGKRAAVSMRDSKDEDEK